MKDPVVVNSYDYEKKAITQWLKMHEMVDYYGDKVDIQQDKKGNFMLPSSSRTVKKLCEKVRTRLSIHRSVSEYNPKDYGDDEIGFDIIPVGKCYSEGAKKLPEKHHITVGRHSEGENEIDIVCPQDI